MDLRTEVLAIVVGGAPAPGANAAISAIVLESINAGYNVIGIKNGACARVAPACVCASEQACSCSPGRLAARPAAQASR
jgi:hypothetical protein